MSKYLFSLTVRFFLAFSGFLTFIVTAKIYGAEGRGIIGYGTSLFAFIALVFSMNLGRSFVEETQKNDSKKRLALPTYYLYFLILSVISTAIGLLFWKSSASAQNTITLTQAILFSMTSFSYIWLNSANYFYSSFLLTHIQEFIILFCRFVLVIFLIYIYIAPIHLDHFLMGYVVILSAGILTESLVLLKKVKINLNLKEQIKNTLTVFNSKNSIHHLEFLSFHSFHLALTLLANQSLTKIQIGLMTTVIQICYLVYLFSYTAHVKVISYIANSDSNHKIKEIKRLYTLTFVVSAVLGLFIYVFLEHPLIKSRLGSFSGIAPYFLISLFSLPGFVTYQVLSPLVLEKNKIKSLGLLNLVAYFFLLAVGSVYIPEYELSAVFYIYTGFYLVVGVNIFIILGKYKTQAIAKT